MHTNKLPHMDSQTDRESDKQINEPTETKQASKQTKHYTCRSAMLAETDTQILRQTENRHSKQVQTDNNTHCLHMCVCLAV